MFADPGEGPLDHPPPGQNLESFDIVGAFDNLNREGQTMFRPID